MWTNKTTLSIPPGGNITRPAGYFKIIVERLRCIPPSNTSDGVLILGQHVPQDESSDITTGRT